MLIACVLQVSGKGTDAFNLAHRRILNTLMYPHAGKSGYTRLELDEIADCIRRGISFACMGKIGYFIGVS